MGTFGTPSSYNNTGALGSATNPTTAQGLSRDRENQKALLELIGTQEWESVSILDGNITPTKAEIIVSAEGGAPSDDLVSIHTASDGSTTLHTGMVIKLRAADPGQTITVKHGSGEFNIQTIDSQDIVLGVSWSLELKLGSDNIWREQASRARQIADGAQTDASTALARTNPATTTSRGIARVATLADMEPGALVENGPAVIDAKGGVITPTPTAHAVPQADADGKLDAWVSLAGKANSDFSNVEKLPQSLLNISLNSSGETPYYACRAWVNFDATGTVAIRASGNVSSITDNGTADYTVNFTTAMPDANYIAVGFDQYQRHCNQPTVTKTTTQHRMANFANDANGASIDLLQGWFAYFR